MILVELTEWRFVLWFVLPSILFMMVGYFLRMIDEKRKKEFVNESNKEEVKEC